MTRYDNYTNRSTSLVAEAVDTTESLKNFFTDLVLEVKTKYTDRDTRLIAVAGVIKNCVESMAPNTNNPIWKLLINAQIAQYINFKELAETFLETY